MQNHNKNDNLFKNVISPPNEVKNISKKPVGNASKNPFCIYDNKRHAVGSVIKKKDGLDAICTEDGLWETLK